MSNLYLPRTLVIGLGEVGARTADALLTEVGDRFDRPGLVHGLAVVTTETNLMNIETPLQISPETPVETWPDEFERQVEAALPQISQLHHLTHLTRQGISLRRPDEVQFIIIVDLAEPWTRTALNVLPPRLRHTVDRLLACPASFTAFLLQAQPAEQDPAAAEPLNPTPVEVPGDQFDRGCFVAGLINEAGLVTGEAEQLIQNTVSFLILLLLDTPITGFAWAGPGDGRWAAPVASFGLASLRWPGKALVDILSTRWSQALLEALLRLEPAVDLVRPAREAAQQWVVRQKLAPPLLLEQLADIMPALPHHLPALVPDPPWPWVLIGTQAQIELAARRWQEAWLAAAQDRLEPVLAELQAAWRSQAEAWLQEQVAQSGPGAVLRVRSYLAALSELLRAFVEGVAQKLEEAETDLLALDQKLSQTAATLASTLTGFPDSPLGMGLQWGRWPLKWPGYWQRCQHARTTARTFAHLSRGRLIVWQTIWYYEALLPFYRRLVTAWQQVVARWEQTCRQVEQAAADLAAAEWSDQLERDLSGAEGPWTATLVAQLYRQTLADSGETVREQLGTLPDWVAARVEAGVLARRLRRLTAQALAPVVMMPVDRALCRQLPDEAGRAAWLAGLIEQARPFWPYDETNLTERARTQTRLTTWLLLPGGEASPLAPVIRTWQSPPGLLTSHRPEELIAVSLRRIIRSGPQPEE